jgi:predicted nucleotidyltransferase
MAPSLLPLFRSELQLRLLGLLLLQPQRIWTARELQEALGATPASVHRELQRALAAGILERTSVGRTFTYRAAENSPLYGALTELLERTIGIEPELRAVFEHAQGVDVAILHGSFGKGTKLRPESDVDVLVIGKPDYRALRSQVRQVERRAGREIDLLVFSPREFRGMIEEGSSFANSILRGPTKTLAGDLEAVIGV